MPPSHPLPQDGTPLESPKRWWLRGLLFWALLLAALVFAVRECS